MHEMGIAMEIVEIVKSSIPEEMKDAKVEKVNLKVGKLSAIVVDSLEFCFNLVVKDSTLEGVELVIEEVPVVARCKECQHQWTVDDPVFTCEKCQSGAIDILSGRELDISSIEIEEKD